MRRRGQSLPLDDILSSASPTAAKSSVKSPTKSQKNAPPLKVEIDMDVVLKHDAGPSKSIFSRLPSLLPKCSVSLSMLSSPKFGNKKVLYIIFISIAWGCLWLTLKKLFPNHRYHHLLKIPQLKSLLEDAPAPVNDQYVVFVSNANQNAKQRYNIAMGKSRQSAEHAFRDALTRIPLKSATWPWFKIDVVTAVKTMDDFDHSSEHAEMPSWWYGIAFDWDAGFVFLPDEVQSQGLIDWKNQLRWDHIGQYLANRKIPGWPKTVLEDDATTLETMDILHTNSILCDFHKKEHINLYHGHRIFTHLTHSLLIESSTEAGNYLTRSIRNDGEQVYLYRPRSDDEPHDYNLTRHAGAIYALACLYKEIKGDKLKSAMQRSIDYLIHKYVKDCPLPNLSSSKAKCVWDFDNGTARATKLGVNALTVLAIAQYTESTGDQKYLPQARSLADYIKACQRDDGGFVQKIMVPENIMDNNFFVRYYQGEAMFALAKLYNVVKKLKLSPEKDWLDVAEKAADYIVAQDAGKDDEELLVDHWLLYGIAEIKSKKKNHISAAARTVRVASDRQLQETDYDQDKDRLGTFSRSTSATATATKTEGLCAVYNLFLEEDKEVANTILEVTTLAMRYQLQEQYRPEKAMFMRDPQRILGGFFGSLTNYEMRNDYTQHNLSSMLCMARLLKEQEVAWNT